MRRRSSRLALKKTFETAQRVAEVFLKNRKDLERCETSKGRIVFGHIGPKASHPAHLTLSDYENAFLQLCKCNMEQLYDPVWGWNDQQKMQQLHRAHSHFFVAFASEHPIHSIGFCQVDVEQYDDRSVMYVYELQIAEDYRRLGIGRHLMTLSENLARELNLECLVLTCMKENAAGLHFYSTLGYTADRTSPDSDISAKYEILSKSLDK